MSERLAELALKKQRLLARSSDLRDRVGAHAAGLSPLFVAADRVRAVGAAARRHPEWIAAAVVVLIVARPRLVWRWAQRGFVGWRIWRNVRELLGAPPANLRGP